MEVNTSKILNLLCGTNDFTKIKFKHLNPNSYHYLKHNLQFTIYNLEFRIYSLEFRI